MHKLAREVEELNKEAGESKAASLITETKEGRRSYRIRVAPRKGCPTHRYRGKIRSYLRNAERGETGYIGRDFLDFPGVSGYHFLYCNDVLAE